MVARGGKVGKQAELDQIYIAKTRAEAWCLHLAHCLRLEECQSSRHLPLESCLLRLTLHTLSVNDRWSVSYCFGIRTVHIHVYA